MFLVDMQVENMILHETWLMAGQEIVKFKTDRHTFEI